LTAYPGISLSTNVIDWEAGFTQVEVWIYSSNDTKITGGTIVTGGTLVLSLTGVNQNIYTLSQNTMDFFVGSAMILAQSIVSVTVVNIMMNCATVTVTVSDYCMLYYMLALDRTLTPNLTEVIGQGPAPYESTRSVYGKLEVGASFQGVIQLDNLVAQTPYIIYIYMMDRGQHFIGPQSLSFKTSGKV
jgi:hypothetical protein